MSFHYYLQSLSQPLLTQTPDHTLTSVTRTEEKGKKQKKQNNTHVVRLTALNDSLRSGEPAVNGGHVERRLPIFTLLKKEKGLNGEIEHVERNLRV